MIDLVTGHKPDWPLAQLRYVASINREALGDDHPTDAEIEYVDIGAVGRGSLVEEPESMTFGEAPSRARRVVVPGDILVSTVRTYLRAVVRLDDPVPNTVASTGFAVLTPNEDVDGRFLAYYCIADPFVETVVAKSTGVSYPAINASTLAEIPVPLPPLEVQRRVADMLDAETARIDTLIDKNKQVIETVALRTAAVIDHSLGGHPVDEHGWSAPPEWGRVPIRSLTNELFTDGDWIELPYITDSGIRLIQTGNIGIGEYKEQGYRYISEDGFKELSCTKVKPRDILICRLADPVGRACLAPDLGVPMITSVDVSIVRPGPAVHGPFVVDLLSTPRWLQRLQSMGQGGTRNRIPRLKLGELRVPLPDLDTQRHLSQTWARERHKHESLTERVLRQIDLLETRRRSLITAAVTGQITV